MFRDNLATRLFVEDGVRKAVSCIYTTHNHLRDLPLSQRITVRVEAGQNVNVGFIHKVGNAVIFPVALQQTPSRKSIRYIK